MLENTRVGTQKLPKNSERINFVIDTTTKVKYRMFREYNDKMDDAKICQLRQILQDNFYDLTKYTQSNMVYKLMIPRRFQKNRYDILSTQINTNVVSPDILFKTYLKPILVSIEGQESVDKLKEMLEPFRACGPQYEKHIADFLTIVGFVPWSQLHHIEPEFQTRVFCIFDDTTRFVQLEKQFIQRLATRSRLWLLVTFLAFCKHQDKDVAPFVKTNIVDVEMELSQTQKQLFDLQCFAAAEITNITLKFLCAGLHAGYQKIQKLPIPLDAKQIYDECFTDDLSQQV